MKRIYRYVMLCLSLIACCLGLAAAAQEESQKRHVGRVQDWTYHHVTMSGGLPAPIWRGPKQSRACFSGW